MAQVTNIFDFEEARLAQAEDYSIRQEVLGLEDVERGVKVLYPTTIYNVKGDETSGVAGMLMASGEFRAATPPVQMQSFWEFDETLRYHKIADQNPAKPHERCARGDSWTSGEVVWDGSVVGSINQAALDGDDTDAPEDRRVVKRREWDGSLGTEWPSTGELWKGIESGRSMRDMGPRPGRVHTTFGEDDGGFAGMPSHRRAA